MGIRVIKTALAAISAIYLASYIGLSPSLAAGILAILGVEVTRLKGIKNAAIRFLASVLGLGFASIVFTVFGFHYWAVAIFIVTAFPVTARFKLQDGIVTSSVIVFHLYDFGEVTLHHLLNEIGLLIIGLGCATIINMFFMPKSNAILLENKSVVESNFSSIFVQMAKTLRNPQHIWSGEELLLAHDTIKNGFQLSVRALENRFWDKAGEGQRWLTYFEMRGQQLETIQQMLVKLAFVIESLPQGEMVADLLDQLSKDVKSDTYLGNVEKELKHVKLKLREMQLPTTREEFEIRASLLMLLHEVDHYLTISKRLKRSS